MDENEMSDLMQLFKRATLAISSARDNSVSLYEASFEYVDEISNEITEKRNLYQTEDFDEQFAIQREIEAAVAFYGKFLPAFFLIQFALFEDCLVGICQEAARIKKIPFELKQQSHFTVEEAMSFFEKDLGVQFPEPWPVWEKVQDFQRLRNNVANSTGLNAEADKIKEAFLDEIGETIVLYLAELQSHLLNVLEDRS